MVETQTTFKNNVFVVTVLCKRLKTSNISFLTALFTASLEFSISRYLAQTTNNGTLGSFSSRIPTSLVLLHTTYTCALKPGCLMSHNWLHTPDCKVLNEMKEADWEAEGSRNLVASSLRSGLTCARHRCPRDVAR